jgi:hypothetical protein
MEKSGLVGYIGSENPTNQVFRNPIVLEECANQSRVLLRYIVAEELPLSLLPSAAGSGYPMWRYSNLPVIFRTLSGADVKRRFAALIFHPLVAPSAELAGKLQ